MSSLALRRAAVLLPGRNLVRLTRKQLVLACLALLIIAGAGGYGRYWWSTGRFIERTDDAYVGGNVTVLAPHVPGFVSQIRVADNQYVKAGDLLVMLDDRDYRAKLAHAEAAVQRQQATLANLHAQYELQQSMIGQSEAALASAKAPMSRPAPTCCRSFPRTDCGSMPISRKISLLACGRVSR